MGRPPLNMQRTYVNLSPETLVRIDSIVGEKQRARFIREAVDQALKMAELMKKIEADKR